MSQGRYSCLGHYHLQLHTYLYILQLTAPTMDSNPHKEDEPTNNTKAEACSPDHESQPKERSMFCALVLYSNLLYDFICNAVLRDIICVWMYMYCCVFLSFSPCLELHRLTYDREYLLSLRFLRVCMEPPEDLFFPGAIDLVRAEHDDAAGPKRGWEFYWYDEKRNW